jgi:hypothetical protein
MPITIPFSELERLFALVILAVQGTLSKEDAGAYLASTAEAISARLRISRPRLQALLLSLLPDGLPPTAHVSAAFMATLQDAVDRRARAPHRSPRQTLAAKKQVGESNSNAKWSEAEILEIRRLIAAGVPPYEIRERHQLSRGHYHKIKSRLIWRHV